ncbi:hypothetical protein ACHQM5_007895 [Ranunculus cassubicifolius]
MSIVAKRSKKNQESEGVLLSGLPDHLAQVVLSSVNNPCLLYSVSRCWRNLLYSPSFPPFLSLYALLSDPSSSSSIELACFDPISGRWSNLPPPDPDLFPPLVLRHPSFIARSLPIQSVSVSDQLVFLAATTHHLLPALSSPLIFNPLTKSWDLGPPISTPRRWCATGTLANFVYLASGVGSSGYTQDVARSAEKWMLVSNEWRWEKVAPLTHGRFSREAVEGVGWRGKLCVVNVKGNVIKEGVLYDQNTDTWREMPPGMLSGWNGPTASMNEEVIYSVDEDKGVLMRYISDSDAWEVLLDAPEIFKGAVQIAARGGRVCVVCGGGTAVVVVDVVAQPPRIVSILEPPRPHINFVAVHVLPRLSTSAS